MDENAWSNELSLFATDLFEYLMSRHPLLYMLPRKHGGSHYFTSEVGKCVMLNWHEIRNELERKLRKDFPRFVEGEECFKQYLRHLVDVVLQSNDYVICQVFGLSAVLLGVICFVHRRGMTHFVQDASNYLFFMLLSVNSEEFYYEGGWSLLASVSTKLIEGYDEVEICRQYLLQTVCNFNASCSTLTIKSSLNLKYSTDVSSGITEKRFREVVSICHESVKESENVSANEQETSNEMTEKTFQEVVEISSQHEKDSVDDSEQDSTLNKAKTKRLSPYESPSILKQEPRVSPISESAVFEYKNVTRKSSENSEELEEESPITSKCVNASETGSSLKHSSFQASLKLKASQTNLKSSEGSTERIMPDGDEPSMDGSNSSTAESMKSAGDFVMPKYCLHESLKAETSATNSELIDEVDKFLIDHIMSSFQVRFLTKEEEIKVMKYFSENTIESAIENSAQHKSTDKVTNNVDEPKTNLKDSTAQKDCDVNSLIRYGVNQMGLELINSCQKEESKNENLDNAEIIPPRKFSTCVEQKCENSSAKKKRPSLSKSPKVETGKTFTPVKAKTPSFEMCGVRGKKNNEKLTPIKTPPASTSKPLTLVTSSGTNKTETPKTLKPNSAEPKSPAYLKTHTDRGLAKNQSKSSEKIERGRRLSLPKASPEITKSTLRSISTSVANTKVGIKDIQATDSSKLLPPAVLKSKTSSKDLPLNQLKASSSTISASASKCKADAKDVPVACEKNKKKLQSSKSKIENVKESTSLEEPEESSSDKSTKATENKPDKCSTESVDTRCAETKGNNSSTTSVKSANHSNTGGTRNLHGKSASVDSKSGKPRWR